ncbi:MAG: hypothetical protein N2746_10105 [Deltaproteobacteria bacterium]|nr:hypothetical protein [Deltaproteobacteria bacterium]
MNITYNEILGTIIISFVMGIRFIPIIALSDLFGGRFSPFIVKASLIPIFGALRYFSMNKEEIYDSVDLFFLLTEFFFGYLVAIPFIILLKFLINSSSIVENLFGSIGVLNSQGIIDERNSAIEMMFELIVILLVFTSDLHLLVLKLILTPEITNISGSTIKQMTLEIIRNFNLLSKNSIGYFVTMIFISLSITLILGLSDLLVPNFNLSVHSIIFNSIVIVMGVSILLDKICSYFYWDILNIIKLSSVLSNY